ncbi:3-deoxy-manno-octulosonate cytidylyltransferase [Agaribacterium haliotis]|uniref:3-deoxy-manno-octulosonate cytidylyltransferase n=1 Tax=Agaribacterium haliotis TaxID=2013869 RepID=UPI000BB55E06|nr:3-deoxy-manno-octulosonate cytidylyltransferase [Agaribacterium haliotis]
MSFSVIIPARFASTRLPGKPLADIAGKSMIQRVWEQASLSDAERVIIATDHQGVADCAKGFGAEVCMTRADHESGTDRLAEVVGKLAFADSDIVVNVQGDEPLMPPAVINQVAKNLQLASQASCATASERICDAERFFDANAVKVVADAQGLALYFSRAPMPWHRGLLNDLSSDRQQSLALVEKALAEQPAFKHIGIYAYRVALLNAFVTWPLCALESIEKLEQLRILHQGHRIHVAEACEAVPGGIDTQADLDKLRKQLESAGSA